MSTAPIIFEVKDKIGVIRLNRPAELNALRFETVDNIVDQFTQWEQNGDVVGVVITGEGKKAFAAGADIKELQEKQVPDMLARGMQHGMTAIRNSPLPSVAAVNGVALGGGFELALACDIRIASHQARFGFPEVGLGIIPGAGGTQLLARYAGISVAMYHILTGKNMDVERAYQLGIVSEIHEGDELENAAIALIKTMSTKGPLAREIAKRTIHSTAESGMAAGLEMELLAQASLFGTSDRAEGLGAFADRRTPTFEQSRKQRKD